MTDDLESRRVRAEEARQFMRNPLYPAMFEGVANYLDQMALACDLDDKDRAQRIIISRQLLEALRRETERRIEDGDFASFQLSELERKKRLRFFQR